MIISSWSSNSTRGGGTFSIDLSTDRGTVSIRPFCAPEDIAGLTLTETFKEYVRYHPIISKIESLARAASLPDANVVLAASGENTIVGFAILKYPGPGERWRRVGDRVMMELAVVEVGREWRESDIGKTLLQHALDHPLKEDRILYMVGYSWTWDLEGTGKDPMSYRDMMIHLFSQFGFKIYQTNESNVMLRPENLFMARIGENISEEVQKKFKLVLFNMDR